MHFAQRLITCLYILLQISAGIAAADELPGLVDPAYQVPTFLAADESRDSLIPLASLPQDVAAGGSPDRIGQLEARVNELEAALKTAKEQPTAADNKAMSGSWGKDGFTAESKN